MKQLDKKIKTLTDKLKSELVSLTKSVKQQQDKMQTKLAEFMTQQHDMIQTKLSEFHEAVKIQNEDIAMLRKAPQNALIESGSVSRCENEDGGLIASLRRAGVRSIGL